jgi:uncharacterized membrane protein HdeD (DUF308 family)
VRCLSLTTRVSLATALSVLGAAILVSGPIRLHGQWVDHCQHRVGRTHWELIVSLALGVVAFFAGSDSEQNRIRVGQVIGSVVAVGAVVTSFILVGSGCGD